LAAAVAGVPDDGPRETTDDELLALEERALRSRSALAAACGSDGLQRHVTIFVQAIDSQHQDGSWGSDDYPNMKPCFTAQTIDMIWHLEKRHRLDETTTRPTLMSIERIQRAITWLKEEQRPDGSWGEDAWDTCQVLKALALSGLGGDDPNVQRGLSYLRANIDQNWPDRASYWFGPGFYGSSMEAFNRFEDRRYATIALEAVWKSYDEDEGYFRPPRLDDLRYAPAEWHTACVISGLRSFGSVAPHRDKALRAITWLARQQTEDGCWSPGHQDITTYCTMQAILALVSLSEMTFNENARRGTEWFMRKFERDRAALSSKLMAAAVIARTHPDSIALTLPLSFVMELGDVIAQYSLQASSLQTESQIANAELRSLEAQIAAMRANTASLEERLRQAEERTGQLEASYTEAHDEGHQLREQLSSYALKLTANQIAILGILITVISTLLGLAFSLLVGH